MNTKYLALLDLDELHDGVAAFTGGNAASHVTRVELSKGDWESLGRPGRIQVVITGFIDEPF